MQRGKRRRNRAHYYHLGVVSAVSELGVERFPFSKAKELVYNKDKEKKSGVQLGVSEALFCAEKGTFEKI